MRISLASGSCPACGQENGVHIGQCFKCGAVLPWAENDNFKPLAELVMPASFHPVVPETGGKPVSLFRGREGLLYRGLGRTK